MVRAVFIDFDARPRPKTNLWCVKCQKDLKPDSKYRFAYVTDQMEAVHPQDLPAYERLSSDHGFCAIGSDCARKIGIEFTFQAKPNGDLVWVDNDLQYNGRRIGLVHPWSWGTHNSISGWRLILSDAVVDMLAYEPGEKWGDLTTHKKARQALEAAAREWLGLPASPAEGEE